jgi:hypothetical protein
MRVECRRIIGNFKGIQHHHLDYAFLHEIPDSETVSIKKSEMYIVALAI